MWFLSLFFLVFVLGLRSDIAACCKKRAEVPSQRLYMRNIRVVAIVAGSSRQKDEGWQLTQVLDAPYFPRPACPEFVGLDLLRGRQERDLRIGSNSSSMYGMRKLKNPACDWPSVKRWQP